MTSSSRSWRSFRAKSRDHSPVLQAETIHFYQATQQRPSDEPDAGRGSRSPDPSSSRGAPRSGVITVLVLAALGIAAVMLTVLGAVLILTR